MILAGTSGGVYRSTDGGGIYGPIIVGIPVGDVTDLVADAGVASRFYAAVGGSVYVSNDTGASWTIDNGIGLPATPGSRVLLAVHHDATNDVVFAAVIGSTGYLTNVYKSPDQGTHWNALAVPTPEIFAGGQGDIHGALIADATDPNSVWISGDRQNTPFPNVNGANNYSGNIFQYSDGTWQNRVANGANGRSPHADSRRFAYDAAGSLIHVSDGGIFALKNPSSSTRTWISLNGTANIYESLNKGDSVANLGFTSAFIGNVFANSPLTYGGLNANDTSNPGSFYVGAGSTIYHRFKDGDPVVTLAAYTGGTIRSLVSDPKNVAHVFVVDSSNRVWGSFDEGATWTNLSANLGSLSDSIRSIEIFSPDNTPKNTVLLVGGADGVFQMRRPGAAGTAWTSISSGLPKGVLVTDLRYEYTQNVLTVGTTGRGVWSLTNFFRGGGGTGATVVIPASSSVADPGDRSNVLDIPSQPLPVASSASSSLPSATLDLNRYLDGLQVPSTFATSDTATAGSYVSAVVDGSAGLFTRKPARKFVMQPMGDTTNSLERGLFN